MNGIQIVAEARVGNDPELREVSGTPVCNLSLAVTERKLNKQTNQWEDAGTTWLRGAVWGAMAANVAVSVMKGQLVNVTGTLSERKFSTEGGERTQLELRVDMIAPSLRFATAQVIPNDRGGHPQGGQQPQQQWSPGAPQQAPWQQPQQAPQQPVQQQMPPQQPQRQQQPQQGIYRGPQPQQQAPVQPTQQWQTPAYANQDDVPF